MTVEQAGAYYLDWVCWHNKASDKYYSAVNNISWSNLAGKKYRNDANHLAKITRETARALDAPLQPWPPNVVKPVAKVVNDLLEEVSSLNGLATAKTGAAVYSAWQDYARGGSNAGAQLARLRLGLPSASSKNTGCKGKGKYPLAASASATATAPASPSPTPSVSASS